MSTFGFVTIGQSPRDDVLSSMFDRVPESLISQYGALDNCTAEEIANLVPSVTEPTLVTRLRDGSEVTVSKPRLMPFMQRAVDQATDDGVDALVILCTGEFSVLETRLPMIYPDRLLSGVVDALVPSGTIGVLMPHKAQHAMMQKKWGRNGRNVVCRAASPYTAADALNALTNELVDHSADLIVMDCMGYTSVMKNAVAEASTVPVILSNRLVGRVIEELSSAAFVSNAHARP